MKKLILLLSIVIFTSCSETETQVQAEAEKFPVSINFTEIGKGTLTGSGFENLSETKTLINKTEDWTNLLSEMNAVENVSNGFNEAEINFETHTIIVIILELKGTGWEIDINDVIENSENIVISSKEIDFFTLTYSQPFHIVMIPKTEKQIVFN